MPSVGIRIWGNSHLAPQREVESGVNDIIVINVNGTDYTIVLDAGEYTSSHEHVTSSFVQHVNDKLIEVGCPVIAKVGGIHDDHPRTVLLFETSELSERVTMSIEGPGAVEFIGDTPYQTVPAVVETQIDGLPSKVAARGTGMISLTGGIGVS
ncbi:hypothetical protein MKY87_01040 [Paenibacillus sp. FSL R7-0198]|uniref:hypothetical protein n=1 Tax=unclassified Paenibacillus TaxID=185978 RepID=UPI0030D95669